MTKENNKNRELLVSKRSSPSFLLHPSLFASKIFQGIIFVSSTFIIEFAAFFLNDLEKQGVSKFGPSSL